MKVHQETSVKFTNGSNPVRKPRGFRSGLVKYVMDKMKEKA